MLVRIADCASWGGARWCLIGHQFVHGHEQRLV